MPDDRAFRPGSDLPPTPPLPLAVSPGAYAAPAQFLVEPEELALLSQLAAQLLADPLALQQLSDRVVELMQQDLNRQRERDRGYGRRW